MKICSLGRHQHGRTVEVNPDGFMIGRSSKSHLKLADSWVSRQHCLISRNEGRWVIRDLGSTNGTMVNGKHIQGEQELSPGDRIKLNDQLLLIAEDDAQLDPDELLAVMEAAGEGVTILSEGGPFIAVPLSDRVRIQGKPSVEYRVLVSAKLENKRIITEGGKLPLEELRATGQLARSVSSRKATLHRQYIRFDHFRITGTAECRLKAAIELTPKRREEQERPTVAAVYTYAIDFVQDVPEMSQQANGVPTPLEFGRARHFASVGVPGDKSGATTALLNGQSFFHNKLLHGVHEDEVERFLGTTLMSVLFGNKPDESHSPEAHSAELQEKLAAVASKAANLYRKWYGERWRHATIAHDSQVHIGKLCYRFNAEGEQTTQSPEGMDTRPVYRML